MSIDGFGIREAELSDLDCLCGLLAQLFEIEGEFEPDLSRQRRALKMMLGDRSIGQIFVACHKERPIGMASLLFTVSTALGGRAAWLEDMIVDRGMRARGVGSALLEHVFRYACSIDCQRLTLLTDFENEKAIRWYVRHGFKLSNMRAYRKLM